MQGSLQKKAIVIRRAFHRTDILMNIFQSAHSRNIHVFWPYNKRFSTKTGALRTCCALPGPGLVWGHACGPSSPPAALQGCQTSAEQQPWTAAQPPMEAAWSSSGPTAGGEKKKASLAKSINEQRNGSWDLGRETSNQLLFNKLFT